MTYQYFSFLCKIILRTDLNQPRFECSLYVYMHVCIEEQRIRRGVILQSGGWLHLRPRGGITIGPYAGDVAPHHSVSCLTAELSVQEHTRSSVTPPFTSCLEHVYCLRTFNRCSLLCLSLLIEVFFNA